MSHAQEFGAIFVVYDQETTLKNDILVLVLGSKPRINIIVVFEVNDVRGLFHQWY